MVSFCPARAVYFIHDHGVHDTTGFKRYISRLLVKALACVSSLRVVHDPSFCAQYKAVYLPHPLYAEFPSTEAGNATTPPPKDKTHPLFGAIGAIRPYKHIDKMLAVWPQEASLLIKGRAQAEYAVYLQNIVESRNLTKSVSLQPYPMTQEELDLAFDSIDVLLLPHEAGSALVSGSFFEGVGRVPVIIARSTPFIEWAAKQIPSILSFNNDNEIPTLLEQAKKLINKTEATETQRIASAAFGAKRCMDDYRAALGALNDKNGW